MVSLGKSQLPVVSTKHFSIGPNARISVQDFLRDLAGSSRATEISHGPPEDQSFVVPRKETVKLSGVVRDAGNPSEPDSLIPSVSIEGQAPLSRCSACKEFDTNEEDVLRPDFTSDLETFNTRSSRIIHTYSKKTKGSPRDLLTAEIVPSPSFFNASADDQPCLRTGSKLVTTEPGRPIVHSNGPVPPTPPRSVKTADSNHLRGQSRRAAVGEVINVDRGRPKKVKKRRRRAPNKGLVLLYDVPGETAYSTEPEVSQVSATLAFLCIVVIMLEDFNISSSSDTKDNRLSSFSTSKLRRMAWTSPAVPSRLGNLLSVGLQHPNVDLRKVSTGNQPKDRNVLKGRIGLII